MVGSWRSRHVVFGALRTLVVLAAICACSQHRRDGQSGQGADASGDAGTSGATGDPQGGSGGSTTPAGSGGTNAGNGGRGGRSGSGGMMMIGGAGGAIAGTSGGGSGGRGGMITAGNGGMSAGTGGLPMPEGDCIVARRFDECCFPWVAISEGEATANPCIVRIGEPMPVGQNLPDCSPEICPDILCPLVPQSRVAQRADGACVFTDECSGPTDCVIARDDSSCCGCTEAMPVSLVERKACLTREGEATSRSCGFDALQCATVRCAACELPEEPTCMTGGDYKRCQ